MNGEVYFIQSGEAGPIKIGFTRDVESRIAALQTAHPNRLELLGSVRGGGYALEKRLHAKFSKHRQRGEWFSPVPELLEQIRILCATETAPPTPEDEKPLEAKVDFCDPATLSLLLLIAMDFCGAADPEIADAARVSLERVQEWRMRSVLPTLEEFCRLCRAFNMFDECWRIAVHGGRDTPEGFRVRRIFDRARAKNAAEICREKS